ncbi:hypothetical protein [Cohnella faecalis]|uniref:hypothetical protein n=1 Tax=Cohnella faecalis TaxID=2315694 RepID=UPI001F1A0EEA|nr:hypothetical protein [Cohnella faecalis]
MGSFLCENGRSRHGGHLEIRVVPRLVRDGTVDLAPLGSSVDPEAKAKIEELLAKYKKEDPSIFTGPLVDQSGAEKVASGKVLTDAEVLSMDWFVKGVDGSIPK